MRTHLTDTWMLPGYHRDATRSIAEEKHVSGYAATARFAMITFTASPTVRIPSAE